MDLHPDNSSSWNPEMRGDLGASFEKIKNLINTPFTSKHKLDFYYAMWDIHPEFCKFRIGTCNGLYGSTESTYDIIAVVNDEPGNGHFVDVLEWFERSCRRDERSLRFMEIMNEGLRKHLMTKRGFIADGTNLIKHFKP